MSADAKEKLYWIEHAEYSATRNEILQLSGKQSNILLFTLPVTGFAFTYARTIPHDAYVFAVLSIVLSAMGLLYCDADRAILRCASYIVSHLRPQIVSDIGPLPKNEGTRALKWEYYIRGEYPIGKTSYALPKVRSALFQGALIGVPAILCFVYFCWLGSPQANPDSTTAKPQPEIVCKNIEELGVVPAPATAVATKRPTVNQLATTALGSAQKASDSARVATLAAAAAKCQADRAQLNLQTIADSLSQRTNIQPGNSAAPQIVNNLLLVIAFLMLAAFCRDLFSLHEQKIELPSDCAEASTNTGLPTP